MTDKKVKVETFEGPVEYEFTGFPDVGNSPREEPVPPRKVVYIKEKKKKKKKKKKTKARGTNWQWLFIFSLLAVAMYFIVFPPVNIPKRSTLFESLIITRRGHNTSAVPFDARRMQAEKQLPFILVNQMKNRPSMHVLCMHHIRHAHSVTYQACAVRSATQDIYYYMVNPNIVKLSGKEITIEEDSISALQAQRKMRRQCVLAEWTDHAFNFTANICGAPAISLQMAIEEFY